MKLAHSATYSSPLQSHLNLDISNSITKVLTASNFSGLVDTTIILFSVLQPSPTRAEQPNYGSRNLPILSPNHHQPNTETTFDELLRTRESRPVAHAVFPLQPHC